MASRATLPLLAVASQETVRVHQVATETVVAAIPGWGWRHRALAFSPDGTLLAGPMTRDSVALWSLGAWRLHASVAASADRVAFSPDSTLLATATPGGMPRLWRVTDGQPANPAATLETTRPRWHTASSRAARTGLSSSASTACGALPTARPRRSPTIRNSRMTTPRSSRWLPTAGYWPRSTAIASPRGAPDPDRSARQTARSETRSIRSLP